MYASTESTKGGSKARFRYPRNPEHPDRMARQLNTIRADGARSALLLGIEDLMVEVLAELARS